MRIDELQIGDWVFDINNDIECQVDIKDFRNGGEYILDYYEPIPLTAEILEKNGFKLISEEDKMYRLNLTEDESVAITADFKADEPYVHARNNCYNVSPRCFHVHQLQNALKAIGIYVDVIKKI